MEILLELLLQVVGEVLLQALFEFGFRALAEPFRRERRFHPAWALFCYIVLGVIGGAISVWLIPDHLIQAPLLRYANLATTPIALGFLFEWMGARREIKGKQKMVFDRFAYGFFFALTMNLIRFVFAI